MLGTPDLTAILGAVPDQPDWNRNHDAVREFIREACKAGLAVMLCLPGTKQPADMRTVRRRNADDKAAQEAAKDAGRRNWAQTKSPSGLDLATTDHKDLLKTNGYLDEYIRLYSGWAEVQADGTYGNRVNGPTAKQVKDGTVVMVEPVAINLAIEVGQSRVVVVDCDTLAQKQRFLNWLAGGADLPPTVKSPGQYDQATGQWLHSDGGHYYFTVPDGMELPANLGALTVSGDDGFAILWNRRYVLIPPSTRPEGLYRVTGADYPLPVPLLDEITKAGQARAARTQAYQDRHTGDDVIAAPGDDFSDIIDQWADETPWSDILTPLGWWPAARTDNCGCEVWTAGPGHANPKSATAHDTGCSLGRYTEVNTPLHIWTDNPGEPFASWIKDHGTQTMSKLQVAALTQHGGDMGKAMDALGLKPQDELAKATGLDQGAIGQAAGVATGNMDTPLWGNTPPSPAAGWPPAPQPQQQAPAPQPAVESPFAALTGQGQTVLDRMTPEQRQAAEAHLAAVDQKLATPTPPPATGMTDEQRAAVDAVRAKKAAAQQANDDLAAAQVEALGKLERPDDIDEFGTHTAILTVQCDCGATFAKDYVRKSPEFAKDADGDWWHAEIDDNGATIDSHPMVDGDTDPAEAAFIAGQDAGPAPFAGPVHPAAPVPDVSLTPPAPLPAAALPEREPFAAAGDTLAPANAQPFHDEADELDPNVLNSTVFGVPVLAPFAHWRDMPPPEYIVDGLIEHGGLSCIIGPPGVGKSSVALDFACHIATGKRWQGRRVLKTKVLYMPGEGLSGAVQRIASWEEAHGIEVGSDLILADSILKLQATNEAWQEVGNYIIRQGIGFIIFDTFARMATLVEENSATDVGKAVERFDQVRRHTNAGVLVVHHTAKHSETARGSSALNGALDSELLIRLGNWDTTQVADGDGQLAGKPIELDTTKQKNAEQLDTPIPLMMVNWEARNAPIITGPGGTVDPMQADVVLARPVPEPVIETAVRLRWLIDNNFPEQGVTRTEAVQYLAMDGHTAGRGDAPKAWKRKVSEAVDCAIHYDLIQTLTGTASGGRYVAGAGTVEGARTDYARSIINTNPTGQPD